eukprot:TRINITY_DN4773_c1_g4_i1.p1 TRINITY_DN4773_c1_g4~~TRINITY_DN4773_c1_g4_i1.p1  ORF type:complete len:1187 (+),score=273.25 TRINITY_DN4773_c1_g4_i1:132-3692(+)
MAPTAARRGMAGDVAQPAEKIPVSEAPAAAVKRGKGAERARQGSGKTPQALGPLEWLHRDSRNQRQPAPAAAEGGAQRRGAPNGRPGGEGGAKQPPPHAANQSRKWQEAAGGGREKGAPAAGQGRWPPSQQRGRRAAQLPPTAMSAAAGYPGGAAGGAAPRAADWTLQCGGGAPDEACEHYYPAAGDGYEAGPGMLPHGQPVQTYCHDPYDPQPCYAAPPEAGAPGMPYEHHQHHQHHQQHSYHFEQGQYGAGEQPPPYDAHHNPYYANSDPPASPSAPEPTLSASGSGTAGSHQWQSGREGSEVVAPSEPTTDSPAQEQGVRGEAQGAGERAQSEPHANGDRRRRGSGAARWSCAQCSCALQQKAHRCQQCSRRKGTGGAEQHNQLVCYDGSLPWDPCALARHDAAITEGSQALVERCILSHEPDEAASECSEEPDEGSVSQQAREALQDSAAFAALLDAGEVPVAAAIAEAAPDALPICASGVVQRAAELLTTRNGCRAVAAVLQRSSSIDPACVDSLLAAVADCAPLGTEHGCRVATAALRAAPPGARARAVSQRVVAHGCKELLAVPGGQRLLCAAAAVDAGVAEAAARALSGSQPKPFEHGNLLAVLLGRALHTSVSSAWLNQVESLGHSYCQVALSQLHQAPAHKRIRAARAVSAAARLPRLRQGVGISVTNSAQKILKEWGADASRMLCVCVAALDQEQLSEYVDRVTGFDGRAGEMLPLLRASPPHGLPLLRAICNIATGFLRVRLADHITAKADPIGAIPGTEWLLKWARAHPGTQDAIVVYDKGTSRFLTIPIADTLETVNRREWMRTNGRVGHLASVCINYQNDTCRAAEKCNMIHVDRALITRLRPCSCCAFHGDVHSPPITNRESGALQVTLPLTQQPVPISITRFARSAGLLSLSSSSVQEWQICRQHQKEACGKPLSCKFIHLCREVWRDLTDGMPSSPTGASAPRCAVELGVTLNDVATHAGLAHALPMLRQQGYDSLEDLLSTENACKLRGMLTPQDKRRLRSSVQYLIRVARHGPHPGGTPAHPGGKGRGKGGWHRHHAAPPPPPPPPPPPDSSSAPAGGAPPQQPVQHGPYPDPAWRQQPDWVAPTGAPAAASGMMYHPPYAPYCGDLGTPISASSTDTSSPGFPGCPPYPPYGADLYAGAGHCGAHMMPPHQYPIVQPPYYEGVST